MREYPFNLEGAEQLVLYKVTLVVNISPLSSSICFFFHISKFSSNRVAIKLQNMFEIGDVGNSPYFRHPFCTKFYNINVCTISCSIQCQCSHGPNDVLVFYKDNSPSITEFCLRLANPCSNTTCFGREIDNKMVFGGYYSKKYTFSLRSFITAFFCLLEF